VSKPQKVEIRRERRGFVDFLDLRMERGRGERK
jgi:hypothetical protein